MMSVPTTAPPDDDLEARAAHYRALVEPLAATDPRGEPFRAWLRDYDAASVVTGARAPGTAHTHSTPTPPASVGRDGTSADGEPRPTLRRFWCLLGSGPREVRVLRSAGAVLMGVFDDEERAVAALETADADPTTVGVYVGLNPTTRPVTNVLAAARSGASTGDGDVARRVLLLVDLDAIRCDRGQPLPSQRVPATDEEHVGALERARAVVAWLIAHGVPPGALALTSTGNGTALLVRVDMPNDAVTKRLVDRFLAAVALWHTDERVKVDSTVANASRITRAIGTMNRKGAATPERPHRRSCLLDAPAELVVCPRAALEGIAALSGMPAPADSGEARFDVEAWIAARTLSALGPHEWHGESGRGLKWVLPVCPFDATHDNRAAVIIKHATGALTFRCLHDSCADKDWRALRDLLEPGWRERTHEAANERLTRDEVHKTDLGNSERYVTLHAADLRYCRLWRRWYWWDGTRWVHDETGEHERRGKATVQAMYAEAVTLPDETQRNALLRHALASESARRIEALVRLASSSPQIAVAPSQFDQDDWLFNAKNGTLDLRTLTLREHRREDYISKRANVVYDPTATCPTFLAFLESIFPGDPALVSFVQRAAGYSLVGDTRERVMFVLWGGGKNGKSTLLNVLSSVLGDYAQDTHTNTLLVKHGDAIPNDLAALVNARFVTASEVEEGRRLAEALVKKITGDEMISARFMRAEWFNYRPQFKLWLATNHKPVIRGSDDAIWDRIRLIPFGVRFVDPVDDAAGPNAPRMDKTLRTKLLAEAPGILRWAIEGCGAWQRDGLGTPPAVKQATGDYREEMDHVRDFLDECCTRGDGLAITTAELFSRFVVWCKASRERTMTRQAFAARLDKLGIAKQPKTGSERSRGVRCGIALRDDAVGVRFTT